MTTLHTLTTAAAAPDASSTTPSRPTTDTAGTADKTFEAARATLARHLYAVRRRARLTIADLAQRADWEMSRVRAYERGTAPYYPYPDMQMWARICRLDGTAHQLLRETADLERLAFLERRVPGTIAPPSVWNDVYRLRIYAPTQVPGPVRLPAYHQLLPADPGWDDGLHVPDGLPVTALLEEAALLHPVGSDTVRAEQIQHLAQLAESPDHAITVRVIPHIPHRPPLDLPGPAFTLLDGLGVSLSPSAVPVLLTEPTLTAPYLADFARLNRLALTGADAARYLEHLQYIR
ncbi:Scr1 family TA system antitoxin-like transcriptional regulator [Streptomyces sp. NPDC050085]|uniref:Scr1 family TA system antitoxin-like transcriptional regulator n=1 Tax=Streptomyces sp. NPDC050085 TaxID=3365600 RepID=UPI0037917415